MQHIDDIYCCVTVYETHDLHPYSTFKYLSDVVTHVYPIGNRTLLYFFFGTFTFGQGFSTVPSTAQTATKVVSK